MLCFYSRYLPLRTFSSSRLVYCLLSTGLPRAYLPLGLCKGEKKKKKNKAKEGIFRRPSFGVDVELRGASARHRPQETHCPHELSPDF